MLHFTYELLDCSPERLQYPAVIHKGGRLLTFSPMLRIVQISFLPAWWMWNGIAMMCLWWRLHLNISSHLVSHLDSPSVSCLLMSFAHFPCSGSFSCSFAGVPCIVYILIPCSVRYLKHLLQISFPSVNFVYRVFYWTEIFDVIKPSISCLVVCAFGV